MEERNFIMLYVIHNSFWRKAKWFQHDIFVREAVLAVGVDMHFYGFSIEKQTKNWLPQTSFMMSDVIHKNFKQRLSGFWRDIFIREEVLAVGIAPCSYGFSVENQLQ